MEWGSTPLIDTPGKIDVFRLNITYSTHKTTHQIRIELVKMFQDIVFSPAAVNRRFFGWKQPATNPELRISVRRQLHAENKVGFRAYGWTFPTLETNLAQYCTVEGLAYPVYPWKPSNCHPNFGRKRWKSSPSHGCLTVPCVSLPAKSSNSTRPCRTFFGGRGL